MVFFGNCICFINKHISLQTQNICITFVQRSTNVEDVGPTLYKCYTNVFVFPVMMHHVTYLPFSTDDGKYAQIKFLKNISISIRFIGILFCFEICFLMYI